MIIQQNKNKKDNHLSFPLWFTLCNHHFAKDNDHINTQLPKGLFVAYNNSFQLCQKLVLYDTNSPEFHFTAHFEDPKLELNSFHSLALGCT